MNYFNKLFSNIQSKNCTSNLMIQVQRNSFLSQYVHDYIISAQKKENVLDQNHCESTCKCPQVAHFIYNINDKLESRVLLTRLYDNNKRVLQPTTHNKPAQLFRLSFSSSASSALPFCTLGKVMICIFIISINQLAKELFSILEVFCEILYHQFSKNACLKII